MKWQKFFFIGLLFLTFNSFAQPKLSYKTHALHIGDVHSTQQVEYVSPGKDGASRIWDFSKLKCLHSTATKVQDALISDLGDWFPKSNIIAYSDDAENSHFYETTNHFTRQWGYTTKNAIVQYSVPIVRTFYPFGFRMKKEGTFKGKGIHYEQIHTNISGTYSIEGDAYGILLLPRNVVLNNTLRIKSVEKYVETGCNWYKAGVTRYLWYVEEERYPVLVIIEREIIYSNGKTEISQSAYYNDKILSQKIEEMSADIQEYSNEDVLYNVFPNPYNEIVNISYHLKKNCRVSIDILDVEGQKLKDIVVNEKQKGEFQYQFYPAQLSQANSTYFVRFLINDKVYIRKIVRLE